MKASLVQGVATVSAPQRRKKKRKKRGGPIRISDVAIIGETRPFVAAEESRFKAKRS